VRSHADVDVGDRVEVLVHEGWFRARVTETGPGLPTESTHKEEP
jgi:hypothetical protein